MHRSSSDFKLRLYEWSIPLNSNVLPMFSRHGIKYKIKILSSPNSFKLRHAHSAQPTCVVIVWSSSIHWPADTIMKICHIIKTRQDKLIVDKHCSGVCCDEFLVPQIGCKNNQIKEQWHEEFYLQSVWEKVAILNTENINICGWITKLEAIKMQFVSIFSYLWNICRKF